MGDLRRLVPILAMPWLVAAVPAAAQDIRGRTILYDGGDGQIYVARSGSVFRSYRAKAIGIQYKLGGTTRTGKPSCASTNTASLAGNTLTLHQSLNCPEHSMTSTDRIVVVVTGDGCQLTERIVVDSSQGHTAVNKPGEDCHVVNGNHLAQ